MVCQMTFKRLAISFSFLIFLIYAGPILSLFYFYEGSLFPEALEIKTDIVLAQS